MIKQGGMLKLILGFSAASWISAFLNFVVLPISTRLYQPDQLAKINLFYAMITIIAPLAYMGFDQGYIRFFNERKSDMEKMNLLSACLKMSIILLLVIMLIAIPFGDQIAQLIGDDNNNFIVWFLFICSFNAVIFRYISLHYRMQNAVMWYTFTTICSSFVVKFSFLFASVYKSDYFSAVCSMAGISLLFTVLGIAYFGKKINFRVPIKGTLTSDIIKFSIPITPISFMAMLNNNVPQFMLRISDDFKQLGLFSSAVTLAGIIALLQSGLNTFWGPFVFKHYEQEAAKIKNMHKAIVLVMVAFAIIIIAVQDIIVLLLGEEYRGVVEFLPLLLIAPVSYTIAETTGVGIVLAKKSYINLSIYGITLIGNVVISAILIPLVGIKGAAVSSVISALLMLLLKTIWGQKYYKSMNNYRFVIVGMFLLLLVSVLNVTISHEGVLITSNGIVLLVLFSFFNVGQQLKKLLRSGK